MNIFIPIKKHSERVPGKNFRLFGNSGKPLWQWTVDRLVAHDNVHVFIDTDSADLMDTCKTRYDLRTVYAYARNEAHRGTRVDVNVLIQTAFNKLSIRTDVDPQHLLQMHVTSPFWQWNTLREVYAASSSTHSAMTVSAIHQRLWTVHDRPLARTIVPVNHNPATLLPTQDLDPIIAENSVAYSFTQKGFSSHGNNRVYGEPVIIKCNQVEAMDIDTEDDWQLVNLLQPLVENTLT